jgi:hypothetical protein
MDDCPEHRRSIVWLAMRRAWSAIAVVLTAGLAAAPAAAMPDARNAKPKVLSAEVMRDGSAPDRAVSVAIVGRDRDDVVRGAEISWGDGQPAQGLSACSITRRRGADERRRGRKERFELSYEYPAAGHYTVTVRVYSGGCGRRKMQRSTPRTLSVHVD